MGTFIYGIGKDVKDVANAKIIEQKAAVVSEIKDKFEKAKSVVLFDYRGLSVSEVTDLRKKLRDSGADYKVSHKMIAGNKLYFLKKLFGQESNLEIINYEFDKDLHFTKEEIELEIVALIIRYIKIL